MGLQRVRHDWATFTQVALVVKNPPASAEDIRDAGLIPGLVRSSGGGHGNPLWYPCLETPMNRGAWWATGHRVAKSQTQLKGLSTFARWFKKKKSLLLVGEPMSHTLASVKLGFFIYNHKKKKKKKIRRSYVTWFPSLAVKDNTVLSFAWIACAWNPEPPHTKFNYSEPQDHRIFYVEFQDFKGLFRKTR